MKSKFLHLLILVTMMMITLSCSQKKSEKEYFNLASQYMEQQNWKQAEENFQKIFTEYPNGLLTSKALFMVGYINANHLKNFEKAREYYNRFLEKYPQHELAVAAKYELENLGKDVDQLPFIQDEQQNNASGNDEGKQISTKQ